jgi:hypothetical protein
MTHKQSCSSSYYEIVKYNSRTRKNLMVLPDRVQGLSEVNRRITILNEQLKASKEDERGDIMYFRRKV